MKTPDEELEEARAKARKKIESTVADNKAGVLTDKQLLIQCHLAIQTYSTSVQDIDFRRPPAQPQTRT